MSRQTKLFGVVLCLVAMVSFSAWPLWQWLTIKTASASLRQRTEAAVAKRPDLKPALNIAMQDGVLTWAEVKEIMDAAGEKVDPE